VEKARVFVKIPKERIGVIIGPNGRVKDIIEKKLSIKLQIDSEAGNIVIALTPTAKDPSLLFRAKEVVTAIGRGFSPERTFRLLEDDDTIFVIIDLREIVGRAPSDLKRLKGRIIGRNGKMRMLIEELTGTSMSVYGYTVSIIGSTDQAEMTRAAVNMLIKGKQHRTVQRFLYRKRRELKKKKLALWETPLEKLEA